MQLQLAVQAGRVAVSPELFPRLSPILPSLSLLPHHPLHHVATVSLALLLSSSATLSLYRPFLLSRSLAPSSLASALARFPPFLRF